MWRQNIIKMDLYQIERGDGGWIQVAQDRVRWKYEIEFMGFRVPGFTPLRHYCCERLRMSRKLQCLDKNCSVVLTQLDAICSRKYSPVVRD